MRVIGSYEETQADVNTVKNDLSSVAVIYPNLYKVTDGYIFAAIQSTGAISANSGAASIIVPCSASKKYIISKTSGNKFVVGNASSMPTVDGSCTNVVTDDNASAIEYTTSEDAQYIIATVWTSSDGDKFTMLESVSVKESGTDTAIDRVARASVDNADRTTKYIEYKKQTEKDNKLYVMQNIDLTATNWNTDKMSVANVSDDLVFSCTSTGTHNAWYSFDNAVDFSRCWLGVDLTVAAGTSGESSSYENISEILIALSDQETYSFDNSEVALFTLVVNASHILYAGEYKTAINFSAQRAGNTTVVDMTAIKHIGIQIRTVSPYTGAPSIILGKLFTYACPKKKEIIVGFDGQYTNQKNCCEYMNNKGLYGTIFTDIYSVGSSGKLSISDLTDVYEAGNLIASYGRGKRDGEFVSGWYNLTLAEKKECCRTVSAWMYNNGFGDGASCVSVNAGGYGAGENELYTDGLTSLITGRIVVSSANQPCGFYGPYEQGHSVGPAGTNAARRQVVDSVIQKGGFAIFIFHSCTGQSDDITFDTFKEFIDYLAEKADNGDIEVITANKLSSYTVKEAPRS